MPSCRSSAHASRRFAILSPGDVIIFKYPGDKRTDYIKRCVAVEGQTVELKGRQLYVNGELQDEEYAKYFHGSSFGPYEVPEGHIFMMGDNRDNSADMPGLGSPGQTPDSGQGDVHLLLME